MRVYMYVWRTWEHILLVVVVLGVHVVVLAVVVVVVVVVVFPLTHSVRVYSS